MALPLPLGLIGLKLPPALKQLVMTLLPSALSQLLILMSWEGAMQKCFALGPADPKAGPAQDYICKAITVPAKRSRLWGYS